MNIFIDVAISMVFIFLLFSIMVSGAVELWQMITRKRAHFLRKSLDDVFNDRLNKNYTHLLYTHPLIDRLKEKETTYPNYIPAGVFADALIDVIRTDGKLPRYKFDKDAKEFIVTTSAYSRDVRSAATGEALTGTGVVADFAASVEMMKESDLKQILRTILMGVDNYSQLRVSVIKWFGDYMASTTTWYKRYLTKMLFVVGLLVAVIFNIDSIQLAKDFYKDKLLRERVVSAAIEYAGEEINKPATPEEINLGQPALTMDTVVKRSVRAVNSAYREAGLLDLPIGWNVERVVGYRKYAEFTAHSRWEKIPLFLWELLKYILLSITGWLITAAALSYGADYWFNLLSKLINIRTSVKPKDEQK